MRRRTKSLKAMLGFLLSLVMVIGIMTNTAFAANNGTLTISKTASVTTDWTGMKVKAYEVFKLESGNADNKVYSVKQDFKSFFNIDGIKGSFDGTKDVYLKYDADQNKIVTTDTAVAGTTITIPMANAAKLDETYGEADLVGRMQNNSNEIALFYTWIEKFIENSAISATEVTADANSPITINNLEEGYYALIFTNVPSGISVKQGILLATGNEMEIKTEPVTITKKVKNEADADYGNRADAEVGDNLDYEITTTVPTLTDYENLTQFEISDTLTNQKLDENSMVLEIGNTIFTKSDTGFKNGENVIATLNAGTYANGTQEFTVTFDTKALKAYQGQAVTLTYQAELQSDAVKVNGNDVILNYTNNGSTGMATDHTDVYTYGIKIQKKFSDNSTDYSAVTFKLYDANTEGKKGTALNVVEKMEGVYVLSDADDTVTGAEMSLATDGSLTIEGLDVDQVYWLEETATADGFNVSGDIQIRLSGDEGTLILNNCTALVGGAGKNLVTEITNDATTKIALAKLEILNQKGFSLPETGGAGTWMFTIGGILLIAAAGGLFVISRKRNNAK